MLSTGIWIDDIEQIITRSSDAVLPGSASCWIVARLRSGRARQSPAARCAEDPDDSIAAATWAVPVRRPGGDEIGGMARALETFREKALELKALQAEQDG